MSLAIVEQDETQLTTFEEIEGELDECSTHLHKAVRKAESKDYHDALMQLASAELRLDEARDLIRRAMRNEQ